MRLNQHPFAVENTVAFIDEGFDILSLAGVVRCRSGVNLEVMHWFEARYFGNTLRIRCHTFTYIGWLPGEHLLLKYHNLHRDRSQYIHRVYNPATGAETFSEVLQRYQFPTFPEVLDELEYLARDL